MINKKNINEIIIRLDKNYGTDIKCYLNYETDWQLLIATILSAQCTDERVNMVTKDLFKKYGSLDAFANADRKELEEDIKSTGFFRNKSKNIIEASKILIKEYNGIMPSDIEKLVKLPGVGRKTANVIRGNIFNIESIVVDTHVKRVSYKIGITKETDPVKIEFDLMKKLPKDHWILYNKQIIAHGRSICNAKNPMCNKCFLNDICKKQK